MQIPSRSAWAGVAAAVIITAAPASARWVHHHQTNPYRCTGQQVWFYDWHPGSDGMGGYGFWDDDIKVCQGSWKFIHHWLHWTKNQMAGK